MEQSSTVSSLINSRPFLLVYFVEQVGKAADKVADIVHKGARTCNLLDASKKRVEKSKQKWDCRKRTGNKPGYWYA